MSNASKSKTKSKAPAPDKAHDKAKADQPVPTHPWLKWLGITAGCLMVLGLLLVVGFLYYEYTYREQVYPGVYLDGQDMKGLTYDEVVQNLNEYKTVLKNNGLLFTYGDRSVQLETTIEDEADNVEVALVEFDVDATAQAIYGVGRTSDTIADLQTKIRRWFAPVTIEPELSIDTETITALLSAEFSEFETEPVNAQLAFDVGGIEVVPHSDGEKFEWDAVLNDMTNQMTALEPVALELDLTPQPATVPETRAQELKTEAIALLESAPLILHYEDREFTIDQTEMQTWLTLSPDGVVFDHDAVDASLDIIAGEIDVPVKEGKFTVYRDGTDLRLEQFENGEDGLGVNVEASITALEKAVLETGASEADLVVEVIQPRATPDNIEDLGITELLGTGTTNFAGSPANRRANIQKGADTLHGLLIAPGEEFSLVTVLTPIDLAHGWLSELVIKGDKLEKEAGGGLCQIGSTIFRATMMSGLEVTARRNHSWAVSYYDYNGKAGVDATIYEPEPDYKFRNDTDSWVLIQSRIEGSDLYFDLYGTSDGRTGSFTEPVNYGYVSPGPTEEVVDESLPPGTRDCVQHAYTGVSASFDYIIERANGTVDTETYTSTYRARPARCLVGPEPKEETPPAEETDNETEQDTKQDTGDQNNADQDKSKDKKKKKKTE